LKNTLRHIAYIFIFRPWLRWIIGIKSENAVVVNKHKQYLLVANHNSHFDTATLMANLSKKQFDNTYPIGDMYYFTKTNLLVFVAKHLLNVWFINKLRAGNDSSTIDVLDGLLKEGKSLIIFPEGTRGQPGELNEFKMGVAVLLKRNPSIPYIPVYLHKMGKIMPKGSKLILPMNASAIYGNPIKIDATKDVEVLTLEIKNSILDLSA
jgi:1-acyl-sn-glycerol-3-phosphate acyltransferase